MTTLLDLIEMPPTGGTLVGLDDWRLAVELGIPIADSAVYDDAVYDDAYFSDISWQDLTGSVRGLEWSRGSDEPGGRPRTGVATITLDNRDGQWTPWDFEQVAAYHARTDRAYSNQRAAAIHRCGRIVARGDGRPRQRTLGDDHIDGVSRPARHHR
jgi:hypothetical protein